MGVATASPHPTRQTPWGACYFSEGRGAHRSAGKQDAGRLNEEIGCSAVVLSVGSPGQRPQICITRNLTERQSPRPHPDLLNQNGGRGPAPHLRQAFLLRFRCPRGLINPVLGEQKGDLGTQEAAATLGCGARGSLEFPEPRGLRTGPGAGSQTTEKMALSRDTLRWPWECGKVWGRPLRLPGELPSTDGASGERREAVCLRAPAQQLLAGLASHTASE